MHLFLYMIRSSVELPMIPTTKIRQDTMVFTYLKAYFISVGFMHMGGKDPRGRPCREGGRRLEALFLEGSEASIPPLESRTNREAPTSMAIRRHSRATALIFTRALHSHSKTFVHLKSHSSLQVHTHTHIITQWALLWAWQRWSASELVCPAEKMNKP